jgi:hypothetical protein
MGIGDGDRGCTRARSREERSNGGCLLLSVAEVPRLEKSPLLANGYNHPPTHLSHMQFMQLGGHPGAGHTAILSPASLPHHLQAQAQARAAEQGLKVNHNMTNIEALAR